MYNIHGCILSVWLWNIRSLSLLSKKGKRKERGDFISIPWYQALWVLFTVLITVSACLKDDMLLIVSLTLSCTWSKHTLMGSVPFILYFIVNGISSNIKWRMSAVWEKQKNQYTSRLHMREARSWGCQALQSLLGQTARARQSVRKGTPAKHLLWKQAVPWASGTLCPTILPPVCKEGSPDTPDVLTQLQCGCEHRTLAIAELTHNSGSTHGWRYPVQTGWIVFGPDSPWGEIQGFLRNERNNGKTFTSTQMGPCRQGPCPDSGVDRLTCAWKTMPQNTWWC